MNLPVSIGALTMFQISHGKLALVANFRSRDCRKRSKLANKQYDQPGKPNRYLFA